MAGKSAGRSTTAASAGTTTATDDATWSDAEITELKETLRAEIDRLERDLVAAQVDLVDLVQDTQDIVGDDQADVGSKAIEREHEAAMAANTRDVLAQYHHALERVEADLQGVCESCGGTIPKPRVQAFPRATLCVACKSAQKR
ncbi:TraR/DksA family transcriptional regulator [Arsenicicoccus sp. oral taxon 190]|uniref:TraR/DksA family transcriptional regulator n=1 Tax=Arsenicicoccus sp. oral taxon 190 TaxID=1658671 RepID=UPI0009E5C02E|nr:TraR/DksA C4-type zinc finger protein [Arsenicicoccus sp. oral taxon 190]